MLKLIIILLLIILIAVIVLCIVGHAFLKMPFALDFKDKKKTGIFSKKWLDWAQDNKHDLIYNYVVPRKIRQDRYAHSHVAHYRVVTNDCYYDTDSAEYFWTRYMKLPNGDPCAMHYYKTKNGEFFCMTSALGSKDSFSVIPEREMKKLLKNEPNLYLKYIPDAERNKDLLDLKKKTEEKEKEQSVKQDVSPTIEDDAAQYASDIEALEKELSEKKKALKDAKRKAKEAEKDKKAPSKKGFHIDINISIGKSEANTAAAKADESADKVEVLSEKEATDIKTMNDVVVQPEDTIDTPKTVAVPPADTESITPSESVPENEEAPHHSERRTRRAHLR